MPSFDSASMSRVGLRLALFCLPLALMLGGVELGLRRVQTSYSKKRHGLDARMASLEVLVTGTSTGMFGVDPSQLTGVAYNVAEASQSVYYDDALVRPRLDAMPQLKVLIVVLSTPSLEMKVGDSPESWREYAYRYYWDAPLEVPGSLFDARMFSVIAFSPRTSLMAAVRRGFDQDLAPEVRTNGWLPVDRTGAPVNVVEADQNAVDRARLHRKLMSPANLSFNVACLSRLIAAAQAHKVVVAMVLPPVSRFYRRHRDADAVGRLSIALDALAARHPGLRVARYFDDERFVDTDFADSDHLNSDGAVKFSRILDQDIVRPSLATR
jgi:hypothetical protein